MIQPFALRSGRPMQGSRALPDGELPDGSPIPAIVPLPGKAMAPMPSKVWVEAVDRGDFGVLSGRRPANGRHWRGRVNASTQIDQRVTHLGRAVAAARKAVGL